MLVGDAFVGLASCCVGAGSGAGAGRQDDNARSKTIKRIRTLFDII
jgi:hypothetical protein